MKTIYRLAPVILVGSFVFMTSQLLSVPQTSPWFSVYVKLDTVAHVMLYFGLGLFVCRYLALSLEIHPVVALILAASVSLTFGVADEFHQMYISGRSAEFGDLLADLVGAMLGGSLYLGLAGLMRWAKDLMATAEIAWPRVLLRGVIVGAVAAGICAPAVVYADSIVRLCQALFQEGALQAQQAVNRYVAHPNGQIRIGEYKPVPLEPIHRTTPESQQSPRVESPVLPLPVEEQVRTVQVSSGPDRAMKEIAPSETRQNQGAEPKQQTTSDLEQQLLQEMRHIMARLKELENGSKTGASSGARSGQYVAGAGKATDGTGILRNKIVQALADRRPTRRTLGASARQALGEGASAPAPCDLVAIITSNTNPVDELTLDQVRKIFSGEYTNWRQVGGPDIPVKVVTVRKQGGDLEQKIKSHLQASLSRHAVRLPLVSLIVPVVAQTQGAVGFLPVLNTEQLDFVLGHKAFKKIAIKADGRSPALEPNRTALNTSAYPLMNKTSVRRAAVSGSPAVDVSDVALR